MFCLFDTPARRIYFGYKTQRIWPQEEVDAASAVMFFLVVQQSYVKVYPVWWPSIPFDVQKDAAVQTPTQ